jgi:FkbM family methyltransferase
MLKTHRFFQKNRQKFRHHFLWNIQCLFSKKSIFRFSLADNSRFDYPLKSAIGRSLFAEEFETGEIEFVREMLKPGDIFFDVGANAGLYTVIAARKVGESGHVYAFEPGERELKLLRHNIAINNLTNVTIIESGVSDKKGKAQFGISRDGAMNSLRQTNHPGQKIEEWKAIEVTTLDDIIQELRIKKVDFIKIDVEGAEKQVFSGSKKLLESEEKVIFLFEASDLNAVNFDYTVKDFLQEIISLGFFVCYFDSHGKIVNCSYESLRKSISSYNFIASNRAIEKTIT